MSRSASTINGLLLYLALMSSKWYLTVVPGSFIRFPVSMQTTWSSLAMIPMSLSFLAPATDAADAGSHPTPLASMMAFASSISSSVTCSTIPYVSLMLLMLLAGDDGENVGILNPQKSKPGDQVYVDGVTVYKTALIEFGDFMKYTLEAREGKAYLMGRQMKTDSEEITLEKVVNGRIR